MSDAHPDTVGRRSYSSAHRQQQSEMTRQAILEAMNGIVAENRIVTFTIGEVARRAGVAQRSVYRHFPTRDALIEGLYDANEDWLDPVRSIDLPATPDEIPALALKVFANFDRHPVVTRSLNIASMAFDIRPVARRERDEAIREVMASAMSNLDDEEKGRAFAVVRYLLSALAWQTMRERSGLVGAEAGKAAYWALDVLIKDVSRRNAEAGRPPRRSAAHRVERGGDEDDSYDQA